MKRAEFPFLGYGVGLRRPHYDYIVGARPAIDWFEIVSENFMVAGGPALETLDRVRENYPLVMHGVSLSIGSTDPLNRAYLRDLGDLARRVNPAWISDHLCWTGVAGRNLHDLIPLPFTAAVAAHVADRIRTVQDVLGRRMAIENVSSYMSYTASSMAEWEFVATVADAADCAILLDINNIFVNAFNHRFDPHVYIDAIPSERIVQFHLAGHSDFGAYLLDSHDHPIRPEVWRLFAYAVGRFGEVSTLIEWDDRIPPFATLAAVADEARSRAHAALAYRVRGSAAESPR